MIDRKIRLQIASIEVYFLGFFFGVHSAFKGRFRSILAMIRDQSCLNIIAIESKTQGDHEELNILLQNYLISSRFNQKLSLQWGRTYVYRKILRKMMDVWFAEETLDSHDRVKSVGHDPTIRIHLFLKICHPIFIGVSRCGHVSLHESSNVWLNRDRPMSLTRSMAHICARAFDEDPVNRSPWNRRVSIRATWSYAPRTAMSPAYRNFKWNLIPHWRKYRDLTGIKGRGFSSHCAARMGPVRPP